MKIVYSSKCLEYGKEHIESPDRVESCYNLLKDKYEFVKSVKIKERDILKVHSKSYLQKLRDGKFQVEDTPAYSNIYEYARLSAGGAVKAMKLALKGENSFSLMRPPGHHAGNHIWGFCYLNNIAIAVKKALEHVEKIGIIDIDCHHGNGTQEIFLGDDRIRYLSLHNFPFFPGTGEAHVGNCYNYPLSFGVGEKEYLEYFKKGLEEIRKFNPDVIAVSAGFDTYNKDPLGNMGLEVESYEKIGKMIKDLGKPVFSILEGGYSEDIDRCVRAYLKGLD
ncbi:MAG: histone deacetylase family protein [Candidatus Nanoarchaeia archaeon]